MNWEKRNEPAIDNLDWGYPSLAMSSASTGVNWNVTLPLNGYEGYYQSENIPVRSRLDLDGRPSRSVLLPVGDLGMQAQNISGGLFRADLGFVSDSDGRPLTSVLPSGVNSYQEGNRYGDIYQTERCQSPWKQGFKPYEELIRLGMAQRTEFKCNVCCWYYQSPGDLYSHVMKQHPRNYPVKCPIPKCSYLLQTASECEDHGKSHHFTNMSLDCHTCGKRYLTEVSFQKHSKYNCSKSRQSKSGKRGDLSDDQAGKGDSDINVSSWMTSQQDAGMTLFDVKRHKSGNLLNTNDIYAGTGAHNKFTTSANDFEVQGLAQSVCNDPNFVTSANDFGVQGVAQSARNDHNFTTSANDFEVLGLAQSAREARFFASIPSVTSPFNFSNTGNVIVNWTLNKQTHNNMIKNSYSGCRFETNIPSEVAQAGMNSTGSRKRIAAPIAVNEFGNKSAKNCCTETGARPKILPPRPTSPRHIEVRPYEIRLATERPHQRPSVLLKCSHMVEGDGLTDEERQIFNLLVLSYSQSSAPLPPDNQSIPNYHVDGNGPVDLNGPIIRFSTPPNTLQDGGAASENIHASNQETDWEQYGNTVNRW